MLPHLPHLSHSRESVGYLSRKAVSYAGDGTFFSLTVA